MKSKASPSLWERVKQICTRWFIDAFSGMAQGLFVTLIAGTIVKTIGSYIIGEDTAVGAFLTLIGGIASVVTGFGIGVGMANALKSDKLVAYSAGVAGFVGAYADKILAYQYLGLMNPQNSGSFAGHSSSAKLYEDYKKYNSSTECIDYVKLFCYVRSIGCIELGME